MSCLDDPDYDPWMCGNDSEPEGSLEDPGFLLPFEEEEELTAFRMQEGDPASFDPVRHVWVVMGRPLVVTFVSVHFGWRGQDHGQRLGVSFDCGRQKVILKSKVILEP